MLIEHSVRTLEELELPKGAELSAKLWQTYEDGPEPEFTVIEEVPPKKKSKEKGKKKEWPPNLVDLINLDPPLSGADCWPPALKIDTENICVHIINSVQFSSSDFKVKRYRWEKRDDLF